MQKRSEKFIGNNNKVGFVSLKYSFYITMDRKVVFPTFRDLM